MHTNTIQSIFTLCVAFEDISTKNSSSSFFDAGSEWAGKAYDASTINLQLRGIVICDMLSFNKTYFVF